MQSVWSGVSNAFLIATMITACLLAAGADDTPAQNISSSADVTNQDLLVSPPADNWISYNGDYSGRRYSSLRQIDIKNVSRLRAQWVFHARNTTRLEVTPVVVNGLMLISAANDAFAIDAATGRVVWHHALPVTEGLVDDASGHINRGVAVLGNRVYMETDNAHLLCLDIRSGGVIWDVAYAKWNQQYGATSAPLIVKGQVLVGTSGGDDGVRGFIAAYDAQSGKLAWRLWTIPAPGEFGSESWPGNLYLRGGGTTWMPGTYDPQLNLVFWGTSNPAPDFEGSVRPGDDLYTDCVLAIDPDTGTLKWFFQFTPHDLFDYDATETPILIDALFQGEPRKLLVQANRNGYVYTLDRTNGKFLHAAAFVEKLNWASGVDAQGRPLLTGVKPTPEGARICPGYSGATNWFAPSYNQSSHMVYVMALEECETFLSKAQPQSFKEGETFYSTGVKRIPGESSRKVLVAYSLDTGAVTWKYPQLGRGRSAAGTMTTAGGLVFFGDNTQSFEAVDALSGKPLWNFNTGQDVTASPMSYAIRGKQYVAIAAGSDIYSFALP